MPAKMARENASISVVGAARTDRNDDGDGFAAIEIAFLRGGGHEQRHKQEQRAADHVPDLPSASGHGLLTSRTLANAASERSKMLAMTFCMSSPLRGAIGNLSWAASA